MPNKSNTQYLAAVKGRAYNMKSHIPKTNTRIEIRVVEHEVFPPIGVYKDDDNPTLEELESHEKDVMEWQSLGGLDRHYFRLVATIGPVHGWEGGGGHGIQMAAIESPKFDKNDDHARDSAKKMIRGALVTLISDKLTTYPI